MLTGSVPNKDGRSLGYGLGWSVDLYRGHELISHSGGIDGFASLTSLLPEHKTGIVVLTNQPTSLPQIITYYACDRLLGLRPLPWNRRVKREMAKMRENASRSRKKEMAKRARGTRPSHALKDYTGEFTHPGYGTIVIQKEGRNLVFTYNAHNLKVTHYHYDIFEIRDNLWGARFKLTFSTATDGTVHRCSIPFQEGVEDIVFDRI